MGEIEEWAEFLDSRGSIHLIVEIGEEPRRFSELEDRVLISSGTLWKRLKEGVKIGVFELDIIERDGTDVRVYRLTDEGEFAFEQLADLDAVEASHRARDHQATVEDARETLVDRLR